MSDSGRGGQPGHVDVDRHDLIDTLHERVIVEDAADRRTRAHRDHPLGLGHLVVDAAQRRRHFPRETAGDDHQVRLAGRTAEHFGAEAGDVVPRAAHRHHLDGAAREAERDGPDRRAPRPLHDLLDLRRQDGQVRDRCRTGSTVYSHPSGSPGRTSFDSNPAHLSSTRRRSRRTAPA